MANSIVRLPLGYFGDPERGRPLFNAKIWIGEPDLMAADIPSNQKQVFGRQEDGDEVPLAQPVRTSAGGYPVDGSGNYVTLLVDGAYSMRVDDRNDNQVYYFSRVNAESSASIPEVHPRQIADGNSTIYSSPATQDYDPAVFFVRLDGVTQYPSLDYTVDDDGNIVFSVAPPEGTNIDIIFYAPEVLNVGGSTVNGRTLLNWSELQALTYENIAEAIADTVTPIGSIVATAGYYAENDGGGATYAVVANGTGVDDGGSYHDMANGNQLELIIDGRVNLLSFGTKNDGATDISSSLINAIRFGRPLYVPDGEYFISNKGANTDGALIDNFVSDLDVLCDDSAVFIADDIDGDMIRITVPADGAGLPSRLLNWKWVGGRFDQRLQKNSTSVPFSVPYPPVNVGTTATAEAIYMQCYYTDSGSQPAVDEVHLEGITTVGSYDHWNLAGGDGGLFAAGAVNVKVYDCTDYGQRDAGVYMSGDNIEFGITKSVKIRNQNSINSCAGVTVKRAAENISITGCHGQNTLLPISLQYIGASISGASIIGNTNEGAWRAFRMDDCTGVTMLGNTVKNIGHTMDNGAIPPTTFTSGIAFDLSGCVGCSVGFNTIDGKNPLYTSISFGDAFILQTYTPTGTQSANNNISDNNVTGIADGGNDTSNGTGNFNQLINNKYFNCTNLDRFVMSDPDSVVFNIGSEGRLLDFGDGDDRLKFKVTNSGGVNTVGSYSVDDVKVLGAQQAAIGDSVGGDEQAKINQILNAMRNHGLIAT